MAKTLADLEDRLRHKLGLPSNDQKIPATDLDISINDGMNAMATDFDWPWLMTQETINTISGTAAYSLPAGHVRTLFVSDTNRGLDLTALQRRDLTKWVRQTGSPSFYSTYGAAIRFGPTPGAVYVLTHVYIQAESALVDPTDEPLCPDHFSDIIVLYAAIEESTRLKDFSMRNAFMQDIVLWIKRMKDNTRQEASTLRVKSRADWPL